MTVQSAQQIRWQLEWNLENETAKASQRNFAYLTMHHTQLKARPNFILPMPVFT